MWCLRPAAGVASPAGEDLVLRRALRVIGDGVLLVARATAKGTRGGGAGARWLGCERGERERAGEPKTGEREGARARVRGARLASHEEEVEDDVEDEDEVNEPGGVKRGV